MNVTKEIFGFLGKTNYKGDLKETNYLDVLFTYDKTIFEGELNIFCVRNETNYRHETITVNEGPFQIKVTEKFTVRFNDQFVMIEFVSRNGAAIGVNVTVLDKESVKEIKEKIKEDVAFYL